MSLFLDREVKVRQNEYNKDVQKEKNVEKSSEMRMFTVLASSTHTETELKSGQKLFLVACEELQKNKTKKQPSKKTRHAITLKQSTRSSHNKSAVYCVSRP